MDNKIKNPTAKFNIAEYEALRNEIVSVQEIQRNMWITMYTLFVALFVVAIEASSFYAILPAYFILIPFQCVINKQKWTLQKISSYILCFFEENNANLYWEGLHSYDECEKVYKRHKNDQLVYYYGATILGAIASLSFIGERIFSNISGKSDILAFDIVLICVSLVLFIILFKVNLEYKKDYKDELDKVMQSYKKYVESKKQ